jgi:glycosyltransferase involved in cell wall biosynthesis
MQITVGTQGIGYVETRTITYARPADVTFVRTYDLLNIANFVQRRLFRSSSATTFANCLHCDLGANRVDLLHLVNTLSWSHTPWVVTFEHYLPRWNPRSGFGMRLLARPSCRKIIAMSRFARDAQMSLVEPGSRLAEAIQSRLCILHPPQSPLVDSYDRKPLGSGSITCTFVGRDFFRKGGKEVLDAVAQLVSEGAPIDLHIVSDLGWGDYATRATKDEADVALKEIQSLAPHVQLYQDLPNDAVLELFRKSHIALLPTYDDTYGFSVLEAQASGTPVISTDVCALPEINNEVVGWMIPLNKDPFGQALLASSEERQKVSDTIREGVYRVLKAAVSDPAGIRTRGICALQRIRDNHSPAYYAQQLRGIYLEALGAHTRTLPGI